MPRFKLPKGYSFDPPPDAVASILVDGAGLYGGADISDHYDALSNHFVLCCATGPGDPAFRLRGFRRPFDGAKYAEVPLAIEPAGMVITGRGNSDIEWIDGTLHFAGWRDKAFFLGTIPSFVAFPSIPSLAARIAALEARIATTPSIVNGAINVPPQVELYEGGQINLLPGQGCVRTWRIDNTAESFRVFADGVVVVEVTMDGMWVRGVQVG